MSSSLQNPLTVTIPTSHDRIFCINVANPSIMFPYVFMSTSAYDHCNILSLPLTDSFPMLIVPFFASIVFGLQRQHLQLCFGWCLHSRKHETYLGTIVFRQGASTNLGATLPSTNISSAVTSFDGGTQKTLTMLVAKPSVSLSDLKPYSG